VPRRTFLSTTAEGERDTDLREKDKEVEEDAEEEETKRAEEAPMARTEEEEEETMADAIAKTSPTTTKQTPKRARRECNRLTDLEIRINCSR
jgi:predicted phage-related endonuclease